MRLAAAFLNQILFAKKENPAADTAPCIPLGMLRSVETQHPPTTRIPLGMPPNKAK
jgi:hypothetical protein